MVFNCNPRDIHDKWDWNPGKKNDLKESQIPFKYRRLYLEYVSDFVSNHDSWCTFIGEIFCVLFYFCKSPFIIYSSWKIEARSIFLCREVSIGIILRLAGYLAITEVIDGKDDCNFSGYSKSPKNSDRAE
jgi:hypothetical protein